MCDINLGYTNKDDRKIEKPCFPNDMIKTSINGGLFPSLTRSACPSTQSSVAIGLATLW